MTSNSETITHLAPVVPEKSRYDDTLVKVDLPDEAYAIHVMDDAQMPQIAETSLVEICQSTDHIEYPERFTMFAEQKRVMTSNVDSITHLAPVAPDKSRYDYTLVKVDLPDDDQMPQIAETNVGKISLSTDCNEYPERFTTFADKKRYGQYTKHMREGGPKAVEEMVLKHQEVLKNLPKDVKKVAGIAFEELEIGKILAEADRKDVPLKFYAGDGKGVFVYKNKMVKTPEYVDAVFHNTETGKYYAVQYKYTDRPEHLVEMKEKWLKTHQNKQPAPETVPDEMLLENVQLIGPKDVVKQMKKNDGFNSTTDVGDKHKPAERDEILDFLKKNENMLKGIAQNQDILEKITIRQQLKANFERKTNTMKKMEHSLTNAKAKQQDPNCDINKVNREILGKQKAYDKMKKEVDNLGRTIEGNDKYIKDSLQKAINRNVLKEGGKQIMNPAALNAATDCAITLIISGHSEITKWSKGDISLTDCATEILKKTTVTSFNSGARGAAFCIPNVASKCLTQYGHKTTGSAMSGLGKVIGPGLMLHSAYTMCNDYKKGNITGSEAMKTAGRQIVSTAIPTVAKAMIGGPVGVAVGIGANVVISVGEYFWSQ